MLGACLAYLAQARGTRARSRHVRLAAMHAFFHDAARPAPSHRGVIQRVLALPRTRDDRTPIALLTGSEIDALVAAPDQPTWAGRRDRTLLLVAVQTGRRVSELSGLCWPDITWGMGAPVRCHGKGRKVRCIPLRHDAISALRAWQREPQRCPDAPVLPNARGGPLRREGVAYLLATHVATAQQRGPSVQGNRVSPQVLRHRAAMALRPSGVAWAVIARWRGHESMDTPQMSLHASLELTQQALAKTTPVNGHPGRSRPDDTRLAFLQRLS